MLHMRGGSNRQTVFINECVTDLQFPKSLLLSKTNNSKTYSKQTSVAYIFTTGKPYNVLITKIIVIIIIRLKSKSIIVQYTSPWLRGSTAN